MCGGLQEKTINIGLRADDETRCIRREQLHDNKVTQQKNHYIQ
jgi:hypothetical protein